METVLIAVGKTNTPYIKEGIDEYCRRLSRHTPFKIIELPDPRNTRSLSEQEQKVREGKLLLSNLTTADHVALLDEHGKERTSMEFASYMEKRLASGKKTPCFHNRWTLRFLQRDVRQG